MSKDLTDKSIVEQLAIVNEKIEKLTSISKYDCVTSGVWYIDGHKYNIHTLNTEESLVRTLKVLMLHKQAHDGANEVLGINTPLESNVPVPGCV